VTLKCGLGVVQDHWKWHQAIDRVRVAIRLPLQLRPYFVSLSKYIETLVQRHFLIPPPLNLHAHRRNNHGDRGGLVPQLLIWGDQ